MGDDVYRFEEELDRLRTLVDLAGASQARSKSLGITSEVDVLISRCRRDLDELAEFHGLPQGPADAPSADPGRRALDLSDPAIRRMAASHWPAEIWSMMGYLMSVHCDTCNQSWPC